MKAIAPLGCAVPELPCVSKVIFSPLDSTFRELQDASFTLNRTRRASESEVIIPDTPVRIRVRRASEAVFDGAMQSWARGMLAARAAAAAVVMPNTRAGTPGPTIDRLVRQAAPPPPVLVMPAPVADSPNRRTTGGKRPLIRWP